MKMKIVTLDDCKNKWRYTKELTEIYDSFISWGGAQSRFSPGESSTNSSEYYIG